MPVVELDWKVNLGVSEILEFTWEAWQQGPRRIAVSQG